MWKMIFQLFRRKGKGKITIVSGLPRSGTSMMMRMLEAGGMEVVVDHIRKADEDNPKGYYEFEKVKGIENDNSWLENTYGKVFKMVSLLLYKLPADKNYKVIFMKRNLDEMVASQKRMLERLGREEEAANQERLKPNYEKHLRELDTWLKNQDNIDVLYVSYNDFIKSPYKNAKDINCFLNNSLNIEKMAKVVDKSLYRNRANGKS